jgi:hypothetical protein
MLQILTDMKKPKLRPSVLKLSRPLPASSGPLKSASGPLEIPLNSSAKSDTLADAQRLIAGIAAKILKETKAKRYEK